MCRCEQALELISRQLDEILTQAEEKELSEHLAACEECRSLALELEQLHEDMSLLAQPVPEGFADSVMASIRREGRTPERTPQKRSWKQNWRVWGGLAAAVVLVVLGTGRLNLMGMGASSGATAAAPVPAPAALTERADASSAAGETNASAEDKGAENAERSYSMTARAPEEPVATGKSSEELGIIQGYCVDTVSGAVLTAHEAGYKVMEVFSSEDSTVVEEASDQDSVILKLKISDVTYTLEYTGLSGDGSRYTFALKGNDGTDQIWTVTIDGSTVTKN